MIEPPAYMRLLQSAKTSFAMTVLNKVVEKAFVFRMMFPSYYSPSFGGGRGEDEKAPSE